jgi:hypothetical protein
MDTGTPKTGSPAVVHTVSYRDVMICLIDPNLRGWSPQWISKYVSLHPPPSPHKARVQLQLKLGAEI